ncbi:probable bifunctional dTTP/UTP pyrophosphatase/methyltransferase protein isoform X2 [Erinaceus europaeus]|uniref:Probable bifunctional dTTP/UTP pyrophosphatase/methyltransferase protein isoform X2 n=1 Tax=Erinaceus europaeus TaxID=9365 RepID=A0ABM3WRA8_ERIEU|nr:probable bifunctional dTTP/UTP pyrophosphatase/methyltransferase protein isoform X2 [Erinaceus europaeus]
MVLLPVLGKLQHKRVVLASASPRRREILSNAGLRFEVVPSRFRETLDKAAAPGPAGYAEDTARHKALEVARRLHQKDLRTPDIVIGADTIVAVGGLILEKPVDKQDAYRMLSRLSGKEHSVFTGVAVVFCSCQDGRLVTDVRTFHEETRVTFSELSEELLWEYIHSGEPMDKAGGYGIQALGGMLVESVRGDFLNVVGFPLNRFCKQLAWALPAGDGEPGGQRDAPHGGEPGGQSSSEPGGQHSGEPSGQRDAQHDGPPPPPDHLLQLLDGFKASKAVLTACRLGLFDLLSGGAAPLSATQVADSLVVSPEAAARLLDALAALGLLTRSDGGYSAREATGRHLASRGPGSLRGLALLLDGPAWDAFSRLEATLRGARPPLAPGIPSALALDPREQDLVTHTDPETRLRFLAAEHGRSWLTARRVAATFDLSRFSSACHLGGGTGVLARELARRHPGLRVTVLDLPGVVDRVPRFQPAGDPHPDPGVSFVAGDWLQASPRVDLQVLSWALPTLPPSPALGLLGRLRERCPPGGGLLLVETALDEDSWGSPGAVSSLLDQLVASGDPTRSPRDLKALLRAAGFEDVRLETTDGGLAVLLATGGTGGL